MRNLFFYQILVFCFFLELSPGGWGGGAAGTASWLVSCLAGWLPGWLSDCRAWLAGCPAVSFALCLSVWLTSQAGRGDKNAAIAPICFCRHTFKSQSIWLLLSPLYIESVQKSHAENRGLRSAMQDLVYRLNLERLYRREGLPTGVQALSISLLYIEFVLKSWSAEGALQSGGKGSPVCRVSIEALCCI